MWPNGEGLRLPGGGLKFKPHRQQLWGNNSSGSHKKTQKNSCAQNMYGFLLPGGFLIFKPQTLQIWANNTKQTNKKTKKKKKKKKKSCAQNMYGFLFSLGRRNIQSHMFICVVMWAHTVIIRKTGD